MATKKRVGLWGATQVGKTALLATALYGDDPVLQNLIRSDDAGSINMRLFDVYRRLRNNQLVPSTSANEAPVQLRIGTDYEVELLDVRGGLILEIGSEGVQSIVRSCDAMLFLVEYDGRARG